jgi:hypothetical protein
MTLTVNIKISSLAPDKEAMIGHARKRIREKIWEMAYGHLREPIRELREAANRPNFYPIPPELKDSVDKLEEAVGEA